METYGKAWGKSEVIFKGPNISIHRLEVIKDGFTSLHHHQSKSNLFYVESGAIKVISHNNGLIDETILNTGESTIIHPPIKHRFIGIEDSIVYEIYFCYMKEDDIIRDDQGGVL